MNLNPHGVGEDPLLQPAHRPLMDLEALDLGAAGTGLALPPPSGGRPVHQWATSAPTSSLKAPGDSIRRPEFGGGLGPLPASLQGYSPLACSDRCSEGGAQSELETLPAEQDVAVGGVGASAVKAQQPKSAPKPAVAKPSLARSITMSTESSRDESVRSRRFGTGFSAVKRTHSNSMLSTPMGALGDDKLAKQARAERPTALLLKEICAITGLAYGEVWQRPTKTKFPAQSVDPDASITLSNFNSANGTGDPGMKSIFARFDQRKSIGGSTSGGSGRDSSLHSVRESSYHSMRGGIAGVMTKKSFRVEEPNVWDTPERYLKHTGISYRADWWVPESKKDFNVFVGLGHTTTYPIGQGLPGGAWQRGNVDWYDFTQMRDDVFMNKDERTLCAFRMFQSCISFPIVDKAGSVVAVMVFYGKSASLEPLFKGGKRRAKMIGARNPGLAKYVQRAGLHALEYEHILKDEFFKMLEECNQDNVDVNRGGASKVLLDPEQAPMSTQPAKEAKGALPLISSGEVSFFENLLGEEVGEHEKQEAITCAGRAWGGLKAYGMKWTGGKGTPPKANTFEFCAVSLFGCFTAMIIIMGMDKALKGYVYNDQQLFASLGSYGALATLLFAAPAAPLAQPRNIVGGHVVSCTIGFLIDYLTNERWANVIPQWVAQALVPSLAIAAMAKCGLTHPPAAACALIYISGGDQFKSLGWLFLIFPVLSGCLIMFLVAGLVNNLSSNRRYPQYW